MDNIARNKEISQIVVTGPASTEMGVVIRSIGRLGDKTDYYCRDRKRDDYLLLLTLDGTAWVREGQRKKALSADTWFLLRPNIVHSYRDATPWSFAYVHFSGSIIDRVLRCMTFFKRENLGFSQSSNAAHKLLLRLVEKSGDVTIPGEILRNALLLELLTCLCTNYCREHHVADAVQEARDYLDEHFCEEPDLPFLAKRAGMSRFHFIRSFKAKYGEPPIRHLRKLRIEKAKNLLLREPPNRKIHEIAAAAGFKDPLYFSKTFKQWTGISPEKFRNYAREHFDPV